VTNGITNGRPVHLRLTFEARARPNGITGSRGSIQATARTGPSRLNFMAAECVADLAEVQLLLKEDEPTHTAMRRVPNPFDAHEEKRR
jgi:hypothetical protein